MCVFLLVKQPLFPVTTVYIYPMYICMYMHICTCHQDKLLLPIDKLIDKLNNK